MVSVAGGSGTRSCSPWKLMLCMSTRIGSTTESTVWSPSNGALPVNDSSTSARFSSSVLPGAAQRLTRS